MTDLIPDFYNIDKNHPINKNEFKRKLIKTKRAKVVLYKKDKTIETYEWDASRFRESSDLTNNIYSGYLRNYKQKGIVKAEFIIPK